jgi:hypothetical protein
MVPSYLPTSRNGWISSEILFDFTPAIVLDRSAPLDDAGDRDGPSIGRVPEGSSSERARCPRGVSVGDRPRFPVGR